MTAESSSLIGFENERCHISTTSYNFTSEKPTVARRGNSAAKITILCVSLFVAFILIGFIVHWVSSSPHETTDNVNHIVAAGLTGYLGLGKASLPSLNISQLVNHAPTYESIIAQYNLNIEDTKKLILIWSDWSDTWHVDYNQLVGKKFCKYTRDRNMINSSDAVVFRDVTNDDDLPERTNTKQIWLFNHRKPDSFNFTKHRSSFNLTATHRFDSNIPHLYEYLWVHNNTNISDSQLVEKYIQPKYNSSNKNSNVKVAVFFVDCNNTEILSYIDVLKQYIKLDCYCEYGMLHNGDERNKQPIRHVSKWFKQYSKTYIFYLSLEEKLCDYYISDQFFGALRNNIIPLVRGNKAVYEKLAPHDSYIHIDSFKSMEEMAQYLDDLNMDNKKLGKYLRWKETTMLKNTFWYTQLCNLIQGTNGKEMFMIDNINNKISTC